MADNQPEVWTYAGIRLGKRNKKLHAWDDSRGGELMYFAKLVGRSVGGQYEVQAARGADGTFQTVSIGSLTYANSQHEDAELVAQWQAESRLADVSLAPDRAERKIRSEPDSFELAIAPLRDLRAKSCRM